jgi:hypothetical protein
VIDLPGLPGTVTVTAQQEPPVPGKPSFLGKLTPLIALVDLGALRSRLVWVGMPGAATWPSAT